MAKLNDSDRNRIQASMAEQASLETQKQRAREAYEAKLTELVYGLTVANREAHFHPKPGETPPRLLQPDELRMLAIQSLEKAGILHPDAPAGGHFGEAAKAAPTPETAPSPAPTASTETQTTAAN